MVGRGSPFDSPARSVLAHFLDGLLPRPLPDGFPVLLGPFRGPLLFLAILSPPCYSSILGSLNRYEINLTGFRLLDINHARKQFSITDLEGVLAQST